MISKKTKYQNIFCCKLLLFPEFTRGYIRLNHTRCSRMLLPPYDTFEQAFSACTHSADCRTVMDSWCDDRSFFLCHADSINIPDDEHCVYGKGNRLKHIFQLNFSFKIVFIYIDINYYRFKDIFRKLTTRIAPRTPMIGMIRILRHVPSVIAHRIARQLETGRVPVGRFTSALHPPL